MISSALTISILLAVSVLAAAYALKGLWAPAAVILAGGMTWLLRHRAGGAWIAWLTVGMLVVAAAVGAGLGLDPWLLLIGLIAGLSAGNLDAFAGELGSVDVVEKELERRHVRRLLIVDGLSLLLASLALTLQVKLSFGLAVALGVLALVGLSRAIGFLGRSGGG